MGARREAHSVRAAHFNRSVDRKRACIVGEKVGFGQTARQTECSVPAEQFELVALGARRGCQGEVWWVFACVCVVACGSGRVSFVFWWRESGVASTVNSHTHSG